jgi:hypothetical protein
MNYDTLITKSFREYRSRTIVKYTEFPEKISTYSLSRIHLAEDHGACVCACRPRDATSI